MPWSRLGWLMAASSTAEARGPWTIDGYNETHFRRIRLDLEGAVEDLARLLEAVRRPEARLLSRQDTSVTRDLQQIDVLRPDGPSQGRRP